MPDTIDILHFASMTEVINRLKSPNQFIRRLLFSDHQPKPTENFEIGVLVGNREVAPFVKKNGEAILVSGLGEELNMVSPANIRIKRAVSPEIMFRRQPGMNIMSDEGQIQAAAEQQMLRDQQRMADMIVNAEEYLCAMSLTGTISYQSADEENFIVTFPRSASHVVTLAGADLWSAPTTSNPAATALRASRLVNDDEGFNVTDAIMDATTADAFLASAKTLQYLENRPNLDAGSLQISNKFQDDGSRLLGTFGGVRWWEYARSVLLPDGTTAPLIRPKFVEFVVASPAVGNVLFYGAIPDLTALRQRLWVGERFSKSWEENDPSQMVMLAASRPMPVPRRPDTTVSVQVLP